MTEHAKRFAEIAFLTADKKDPREASEFFRYTENEASRLLLKDYLATLDEESLSSIDEAIRNSFHTRVIFLLENAHYRSDREAQ